MLTDKFMNPRISVYVITNERKSIEMVGDGDEISRRHIGRNWESSFRWDFDYRNHCVKDGKTIIFKEIPDQSEEVIPPKRSGLSLDLMSNMFGYAALKLNG
jgi:hypothetical protein